MSHRSRDTVYAQSYEFRRNRSLRQTLQDFAPEEIRLRVAIRRYPLESSACSTSGLRIVFDCQAKHSGIVPGGALESALRAFREILVLRQSIDAQSGAKLVIPLHQVLSTLPRISFAATVRNRAAEVTRDSQSVAGSARVFCYCDELPLRIGESLRAAHVDTYLMAIVARKEQIQVSRRVGLMTGLTWFQSLYKYLRRYPGAFLLTQIRHCTVTFPKRPEVSDTCRQSVMILCLSVPLTLKRSLVQRLPEDFARHRV